MLNSPVALAVDPSGALLISDQRNQRIRKVSPDGTISTVAGTGTAGFSGDSAPAVNAQLNFPRGIAVDSKGNLFIADQRNGRIRKVSPDGVITTIAGSGSLTSTGDGGLAVNATLTAPTALAFDGNDNLYLSDASQIRKIGTDGIIRHIAGGDTNGYTGDGGPASSALLSGPQGLAVNLAGDLFVAEQYGFRVRKISKLGIISTYAGGNGLGDSGDNGPAIQAAMRGPTDVTADLNGNVYFSDLADRLRKVDTAGVITTVAGTGALSAGGDGGPATLAQLGTPTGITRDSAGNLYVLGASRRLRKITPGGLISTYAGTGADVHSGDDGQAINAGIRSSSVAADSSGNIYLGDPMYIRMISPAGVISTIAGTGVFDFTGDNGPASIATLSPSIPAIAADGSGNVFFVDGANGRIRKITSAGFITTVAGTGVTGFSGDNGPGISAMLGSPLGLAVDAGGNLLIADTLNNRIRKLSLDGTIVTIAGDGSSGSSGDGGQALNAQLNLPSAVAVDGDGNLYIADNSYKVRKVTPQGVITTIAGTGTPGYAGDFGLATAADLGTAAGMVTDSAGNVFVADRTHDAVRLLSPAGALPLLSVASTHTGVFRAGQPGASYSITVGDAPQSASTSGTVTVTDLLPASLSLVLMSGAGWSCSGSTCTNSSVLSPGSRYSPIAVDVTVLPGSLSQVTNLVTVTGGGAPGAAAADLTLTGSPVPVLDISVSHLGYFYRSTRGIYTIQVGSAPSAVPTNADVTVTGTLPAGLTLHSMSGDGWTCTGNSCSRSDALMGGVTYPVIILAVDVAADAPLSVVNSATVSGGGAASVTKTDETIVRPFSCDANVDGLLTAADVQTIIGEILGTGSLLHDLNGDGPVNILDLQIMINTLLGATCPV